MAVYPHLYITRNSQNVANNTTNVTVKFEISWDYGSWNSYQKDGVLTIDGVRYTFTSSFNTKRYDTGSQVLYYKTVDIAHDSMGNKTLNCSASYVTGGVSGTVTASASQTFPNIPRKATITSAANFYDGQNPTILYSNPAGNAVSALRVGLSLDGGNTTLSGRWLDVSKTGTNVTFSISNAEWNTLLGKIPNSNTLEITAILKTTIGNSIYEDRKTCYMTVRDAAPTMNPALQDINARTIALTGSDQCVVRYFSTLQARVNAEARKGASISSRAITYGGKAYNAESITVTEAEIESVSFSATDSRGNSAATVTRSLSLIPYVKLTCQVGNQQPDVNGNLELRVAGNYFCGTFGAQDNTLAISYRIAEYGQNYGEPVTVDPVIIDGAYTATIHVTGLDYKKTYKVTVTASDALMCVSSGESILQALPVFDWGKDDFNFNVPLKLGGKCVADFPRVQALNESGWSYRIWNSGIAECWGKISTEAVDVVTVSNLFAAAGARINYPFLFEQTPIITFSVEVGFSHNVSGRCVPFLDYAIVYFLTTNSNLAEKTAMSVYCHITGKISDAQIDALE